MLINGFIIVRLLRIFLCLGQFGRCMQVQFGLFIFMGSLNWMMFSFYLTHRRFKARMAEGTFSWCMQFWHFILGKGILNSVKYLQIVTTLQEDRLHFVLKLWAPHRDLSNNVSLCWNFSFNIIHIIKFETSTII